MRVRCISSNREMILAVMQNELGETAVYHPLPDFSYSVGGYTLCRDGYIETEEKDTGVFSVLASLGLCDFYFETEPPSGEDIYFTTDDHTGITLVNIMSIISSRQYLLNQAIGCRGAFFVNEVFMNKLLRHEPETVFEFLQCLYGQDNRYKGVRFDRDHIVFTGFRKAHVDEDGVHRQLAELIVRACISGKWMKAFPRNVRNRKYAFRSWLNSIGMTGPEYARSRKVLLERLYGRSDRRKIT